MPEHRSDQREWSYDLTFDPLDNYSVFQEFTTITLSGLFGVTSASGPTSTDFPLPFLDAGNLEWTSHVLNGGTEVQWTHDGGGTGNFPTDQHVFGFTLFASGATNGLVSLATDGMSRDITNLLPGGGFDLDISGFVAGPVAAPEPSTWMMMFLGFVGLGFAGLRNPKSGRRRTLA